MSLLFPNAVTDKRAAGKLVKLCGLYEIEACTINSNYATARYYVTASNIDNHNVHNVLAGLHVRN